MLKTKEQKQKELEELQKDNKLLNNKLLLHF